jgi:broad specificity phosphatase PhoE
MPEELSLHDIRPSTEILHRLGPSLWSSTVILVRHADVNAGTDPGLSLAGVIRANLLAQMLQDATLSAVFVTEFRRSAETGMPSAVAAGVAVTPYLSTDAAGLITAIRTNHANKTVLVVAHSNTVDSIATGLGAAGVGQLAQTQFDRMFVINRTWCATRLCRMRYGCPTP